MHQTKFFYINEANPTCFLGFSPILLKIGFKWVGLALRIQKWVQLGRIGIKKRFKFEFLGLNLFTFILLCVILVLNFQNNERNISLLRQIYTNLLLRFSDLFSNPRFHYSFENHTLHRWITVKRFYIVSPTQQSSGNIYYHSSR